PVELGREILDRRQAGDDDLTFGYRRVGRRVARCGLRRQLLAATALLLAPGPLLRAGPAAAGEPAAGTATTGTTTTGEPSPAGAATTGATTTGESTTATTGAAASPGRTAPRREAAATR